MKKFLDDIKQILEQARQKAYSATALAMVEGYWLMGKRIVEEEQLGKERVSYGKEVLNNLSIELGKGFSYRTLSDYTQFYLTFCNWEDFAHMCAKLNWSHIARYSILKGNEQIFATKYKLYLPTEEELRTEIEREKLILKLQFDK